MKKGLLTAIFMAATVAVCPQTQAQPEIANDNPGSLDAAIVAQVCKSHAPFLVIDMFKNRKADYGATLKELLGGNNEIDLDGDGVGDITHGEMVAKVAELSGKSVMTYGIPGRPSYPLIEASLDDIVARLENHSMRKPSAIIISMARPANEEGIGGLRSYVDSVNAGNIARYRETILRAIRERNGENDETWRLSLRLKRLKTLGVPVISIAGNGYSHNTYNYLNIAGAVSIGALTHDGKHIASYSNRSSLTTIYRIGEFIGRKVPDGIDINNDGKPDFPAKFLSGGTSLAQIYNGTAASVQSAAHMSTGGFYSRKDFFIQTGEISRDKIPENLDIHGDYIHMPDAQPFFIENGKWKFDPARDGDMRQVSISTGTSFAAPNICSKGP